MVAATGAFQQPLIPPILPEDAGVTQIHSSGYRNPGQLPDGAVLVVGAGSSGVQIADELRAPAGTSTSRVGPHDRPPRSYRGRDFCWWLGVLDKWDAEAPPEGAEHVTIAVSGAHGGRTVDFRDLERAACALRRVHDRSYDRGTIRFAPDLAENIAQGDANYLALLDEADAYVARIGPRPPGGARGPRAGAAAGRRARPGPGARPGRAQGSPPSSGPPGYASDYSWLQVDAFDENGKPDHRRGVSSEPGVYFLGLPWQSRRGSTFIWGVWHDARHVADHIATQNGYLAYEPRPRPAVRA